MNILVSGSLAYDYIMDFPGYFRDHILPEKLHVLSVSFLIDKMKKNFGGTAGNIAYNLALMGERPTVLASAGNDYTAYRKWQIANGIDISKVRRVKNVTCATAYLITDQADNQIAAFYPGSMQKSSIEKIRVYLRNHPRLSASIAIVAPGNLEDMRVLPRLYKTHGVPYIYDPGQNIIALNSKDLRAGISGAKVFISNDYELSLVLKKTNWTKKQLLQRVEILVTTLGEKGSVIEANSKLQIPNHKQILRQRRIRLRRKNSKFKIRKFVIPAAKPKNTSDPTGAGDAYRAGLIKGLLLGLPFDKIGKLASVVSVYTVEKYGTQTHTFSWRSLLKRYQDNFKEKLI